MQQPTIDQLFIDHYEFVRGYFRNHSRGYLTNEDIEDMTMEVFTKIWNKLSTYESREGVPLRAWISSIMRNYLIDSIRTRKYHDERVRMIRDSGIVDKHAHYTLVIVQDEEQDYGIPYECLTDAQLEVIALRYGGSLTIPQIAAYVGRPRDGVKAQHHRALNTLRKAMQCA